MGGRMQRVMIVGAPGSGKSTFARALAARTGLPVVHIDRIHWMAGWRERPRLEKVAMASAEQAKPRWIIEGGLSATMEDRVVRADTLIWLDAPIGLRLWRVARRMVVHYGRTRPDLPDGCPEVLAVHTWEFLVYIIRSRRRNRRAMAARFAGFEGRKLRLRGRADVVRFLAPCPEP
ncbi:MAG: AAA family ATPase [Shimia sp.]